MPPSASGVSSRARRIVAAAVPGSGRSAIVNRVRAPARCYGVACPILAMLRPSWRTSTSRRIAFLCLRCGRRHGWRSSCCRSSSRSGPHESRSCGPTRASPTRRSARLTARQGSPPCRASRRRPDRAEAGPVEMPHGPCPAQTNRSSSLGHEPISGRAVERHGTRARATWRSIRASPARARSAHRALEDRAARWPRRRARRVQERRADARRRAGRGQAEQLVRLRSRPVDAELLEDGAGRDLADDTVTTTPQTRRIGGSIGPAGNECWTSTARPQQGRVCAATCRPTPDHAVRHGPRSRAATPRRRSRSSPRLARARAAKACVAEAGATG